MSQAPAALTFVVLGIGALVLLTRRKFTPSHGWGQPAVQPQLAGVYVTVPQGWRRATNAEVTAAMRISAQSALGSPLGTLKGPFSDVDGRQYMIAIETHSNAPKGASILLPA